VNKKYYILGGVLVLLLIVAGVVYSMQGSKGPGKTGEIDLVWWKTFEDSGNVQDIISAYEATHKNVKITYVKKDETTYEQDLVNALAAGTGPDIFSIHNDWLPKQADKLAPMPESDMSVRTYQNTFVDVAAQDFIKDNQIYAVPMSVDDLALYYNKDLLNSAGIAQPPATWPDLVADVQKLTKISQPGDFDRSGIALGTSANVNRAVDILSLLMLQDGTQFYDNNFSSATFDRQITDPATNQTYKPGELALQFYTQFADPAKTSYTWNAKSDYSVDAFTQGKAAMMINYSYMIPIIQDKAPNLNWAVASIPQPDGAAVKVNFANYWGESVSKSSPNAAAAWDFLKFATSQDQLSAYYAKHKLPSSRKDLIPGQQSDTQIGVFADSALTAKSVYKQDADLFEGVFLKMIDDVILRNLTPAQALSNAAQQVNLSLQKQ
jgi:multiple sugar transport system substrate-binding protein